MFKLDLSGADQHGSASAPQPEPHTGGAANHLRADASAEVKADLNARPRRGRPRGDSQGSASDKRNVQEEVNRAVIAQLDALHEPRAWAALLGLPADAALAITGKDRWKLSSEEKETLGVTGSAAARTMMITNPRALAFMMVSAALMTAYLPRCLAELKEMAAKKITEKKPDGQQPQK
jgi:hypothetical protein